jgi:hypothetical protein
LTSNFGGVLPTQSNIPVKLSVPPNACSPITRLVTRATTASPNISISAVAAADSAAFADSYEVETVHPVVFESPFAATVSVANSNISGTDSELESLVDGSSSSNSDSSSSSGTGIHSENFHSSSASAAAPSSFAVYAERGGCSFDVKARHAQEAGERLCTALYCSVLFFIIFTILLL